MQSQSVGGKEFYVASHHTAHVHAVCLTHVQRTEGLAVEACACHHYHAAFHCGVDGVPVYLVAVPVFLHTFSEENVHCRHLVAVGHHEHVVVDIYLCVGHRHYHFALSPDARHDEMAVCHLRNLCYGASCYRGVHHDELPHKGLVVVAYAMRLEVGRLHEELAYEYHRNDDTHHAERIGHGTSQCSAAAWQVCCRQSLLCGTQCGCVGGGTAEYSHHVGDAHGQHETQAECHHRAEDDDGESPEVERDALVAHEAHEVWTHMQSQGIDKDAESECLRETQHSLIGTEMQASCHDAHEENERHSKRYAAHMELSHCQAERYDERQQNDGLYCRVCAK